MRQKGNRGGKRPGAGRKPGPSRTPSAWPKGYDLKTREALVAFIEKYVEELWTQNVLDARLGGCINGVLRLLGDIQGWITKAPLQIIQAQMAPPGMIHESDLAELVSELPEDARRKLWERAKELRLRRAVSSPGQS